MPKLFEPIVVLSVAVAGLAGAAMDLRTRRIPNALTLGVSLCGLALAASGRLPFGVYGALAGMAIGLLLMLPGHIVGATGAGDVKLFAAMGTLLGPKGTALAFVYTVLAGGLIAVAVAAGRRRLRQTVERTAALLCTGGANVLEIEDAAANNRFAYAPAIALGALAAALGV